MNGAGSVLQHFLNRSLGNRAAVVGGVFQITMSRRTTGMPALATCAAMPLPITPEPITATLLIAIMPVPFFFNKLTESVYRESGVKGQGFLQF
jgi:hypothetical protein